MNWDDESSSLGRQVRDNKGRLIGWIKRDPVTGHSHVSDQSGTVGWTKPYDASGPGYSILSKGGRVAHTDSPEYMLALKKQRDEEERKRRGF